MKIQALVAAVALAFGAAAFAQNSAGYGNSSTSATDTQATTATENAKAKVHKATRKVKKATHHAMAKMHRASMRARARMHRSGTHAMGAGPASPQLDLDSPSRRARMDSAYADWQRRHR